MKQLSNAQFVSDLYERYAGDLYAACRKSIGNSSEFKEVIDNSVGDTFIQCIRSCDTVRQHPNPGGWLQVTCRHMLWQNMDRYVSRCLKTTLPGERYLDRLPTEDTADVVARKDTLREIHEYLTEEEWIAFCEVRLKGMRIADVASKHGMSVSKVKALLHKISIKLARYFSCTIVLLTSLLVCLLSALC